MIELFKALGLTIIISAAVMLLIFLIPILMALALPVGIILAIFVIVVWYRREQAEYMQQKDKGQ